MRLLCGEFCGESANISPQRGARQRIEQQRAKSCESRRVWSKSLKIRCVFSDVGERLLISGLQVQVLPGSPRFFNDIRNFRDKHLKSAVAETVAGRNRNGLSRIPSTLRQPRSSCHSFRLCSTTDRDEK
jgi:hypothetical protein